MVDLTKLDAASSPPAEGIYSAPNTPLTDKRAAAIPILKQCHANAGTNATYSSSYSQSSMLSHAAQHQGTYHMMTPPHSPSSDSSTTLTPARVGRKRTTSSDEGYKLIMVVCIVFMRCRAVFAMEEDSICDSNNGMPSDTQTPT